MSLRPKIQSACRRAMRDVDADRAREHLASCQPCAERARAAQRLGALVASRPQLPDALGQPSFLEGVYERAVSLSELAPVADLLTTAPAPAWDEQTCDAAASGRDAPSDSELARELVRPPSGPDPEAWSRVRAAVLEQAASTATARRRKPFGWKVVLVGAAAAVLAVTITVSDGTSAPPPIVFTELGEAPDIPFAIVRYGVRD